MKKVQGLLDKFDKIKKDRSNTENVWQQIADYYLPHSDDITRKRSTGDNTNSANVIDHTGPQAADYLTSELYGGITNPAIKWFDLSMLDSRMNGNLKLAQFLELAKDSMLNIFNSSTSSFPNATQEFIKSLVTYGTACMYVEDAIDEGIKFAAISIKEIFIAEDKYGMVDSVYRKYYLSARQLVQRFGEDKVHTNVLKAMEKDPYMKVEILHCVTPKEEHDDVANKAARFVSYYVDVDNKHLMDTGFYYEQPYIVARFSKLDCEVYGRSPAWTVLPSVKMVNKMKETFIKAGQLQAQPPMLVADDGVMMPLRAIPNGIIYGGIGDGIERVRPLNVGANLPYGVELLAAIQKEIRDSFFVDQLVFRETAYATATEIIQRQQQALKLLAPSIGRIQTEFLTRVINKVFSILARAGKLGKVPRELLVAEYEVNYIAPVASLQKMGEVQKFTQYMGIVGQLAQINPEVLDNIDMDKAVMRIADDLGIWKSVQNDPDTIAQMRAARQQQNAAAQMLAAGQQGADIMNTLASADAQMRPSGGGQ
jgi:hypothetical protein